jgi:hypothetical protein
VVDATYKELAIKESDPIYVKELDIWKDITQLNAKIEGLQKGIQEHFGGKAP